MAKLKNKAMQRKHGKVVAEVQKDNSALKENMQQLMASKDYDIALEVMAEIAGTGRMDAETMYWGAKCYFLLGDYDRAARWLDNVLSRQAKYVSAKVLLASVCIAQKRYEDGLKLCEHVLAQYEGQLIEEDKELLENGLKYAATMQKALLNDYPACRKYLGITDEAANALAKLHKLMDDVKQEADETLAQSAEEVSVFDTDKIVTDIMAKEVSLRDKVKLFNAFAGGCYQAGDYQATFELLSAALQLDAHDDLILKNIAYTCIAAGEKQQALEYAAKMTLVDFALLDAVKNS